jgi:serine/threonine protein kinase
MERLTASRNIIDIYAYCGTSVVTEFAGKELADNINRLNSMERLDMAIQVAQGVADVHGITPDRPSLVHNDLNLANLVLTQDNRPVLNDFNIAILLMKHNETGETCPFLSHFPNPQWRAPEEQVFSEEESSNHPPLVTEKIDIYGLGNVFYRLAVGFSPWKKPNSKQIAPEQKDLIAKLKKTKGAVPLVPQCVTEYDDPIVQVLLEAMRQAYRFDPKSRPSAAELVSFLKQSQTEIRAMNMKGRKPLWDGSPPRKTSSSTGDQQQWFDSTIGNADCGKPKEEEHDELLVF